MLFDLSNKVNTIYSIFGIKLKLSIMPTNIRAQKIDGITLNTFKMIVAAFFMTDKINQVSFFKKTFLVTNVSLEIIIGILFLTLSDTNIDFLD